MMEKTRKEIKINDNRIMNYSSDPGYAQLYTVREGFMDGDKYLKSYSLSRWDDYGFRGNINVSYEEVKTIEEISFDFEIGHPLYIPLLHLLSGDDELTIDDDETCEEMKKYMTIKKDGKRIILSFTNKLENDLSDEKFYVFIKNILSDIRSKIDCHNLDTKERLFFFFQEVHQLFTEQYHQITMDEYLLSNDKLTNEESKKYVKKFEYKSSL